MGKIAFLFPGQGSQSVGMGKDLASNHSVCAEIFQRADQKLGDGLSKIIFEGPQEQLTLTTNAQPALLTTSMSIYEIFKESGIQADFVAGHSLGEYTALVAAGAISFEDGVYAVRKRGEFMEEAVPNGEGTMAAVLGGDRNALEELTANITAEGFPVQLANLNCPGQIVISGTRRGVEQVAERAKEVGVKRIIPLEVSGPFHSSLMKPAAEKLQVVLNEITINEASVPVIANVNADTMVSPAQVRDNLIAQLYSPVLWEDSITTMISKGVDTFIEIGPGKVLTGLVKKINRNVAAYSVSDEESCQAVIAAVKEAK